MSRGGPRPGSGRKSAYFYIIGDKRYDGLSEAAKAEGVSTKTIHNWCRPENKKKSDCRMEPKTDEQKQTQIANNLKKEAEESELTSLEFFQKIYRNETEKPERRDKAAYFCLPYEHPKATIKKGKKEERQERASKAGSGKFKASSPPKLKAVK